MADVFNHSDVNVLCEIVTKSLHLIADEESSYFTKAKYMNNYHAIFKKEDVKNDYDFYNVNGRFNKENFYQNQKLYEPSQFKLHSADKDIWEVPWIRDVYNEDNDSSDEESEEESEEEDDGPAKDVRK